MASAATEQPPSPSPTAGTASLSLVPASNGVLRPGQPLSATVQLRGACLSPSATVRVSMRLGTSALPDRAALTTWLSGDGDSTLPEVGGGDLAAATGGNPRSVAVTVAPENPALAARPAGVYPVQATVNVGGTPLTAVSVVVVPNDAAPVSPLGVVVPITAGPLSSGLLDESAVARLTAADGELTAQLDAVEGTSAILAVDPAVPAAIRALGTAAPA